MSMATDDQPDRNETIDRAAAIMAQALAQGLMEAEVIIAADRDARGQALPQLLETLDRFSEVLSRLVDFTEQLGERVNQLTEAVTVLASAPPRTGAGAAPEAPAVERSFAPGGEGIDLVISAVPGFQELMDLQRALVRLPQVQSATVRGYQDDQVKIQLVLSQPMTASAVAGGIAQGSGRQLVVDETHPEALRLRMRFLPQ